MNGFLDDIMYDEYYDTITFYEVEFSETEVN